MSAKWVGELETLQDVAELCLANSKRWFPSNHLNDRDAITHCALGLAGEAGEVANKVKKLYGYKDVRKASAAELDDIAEELVDTLIYDLVLLTILGVNIPFELDRKIQICEERWGEKPPADDELRITDEQYRLMVQGLQLLEAYMPDVALGLFTPDSPKTVAELLSELPPTSEEYAWQYGTSQSFNELHQRGAATEESR